MVHILLAILKTIGIVLLIMISIILLLIAAILFVPIRYEADMSYVEAGNGWIRISWLLRILYVKVTIVENKIAYAVRIFGKKIDLDGSSEKKKRTKKSKKKKRSEKPTQKLAAEPVQKPDQPKVLQKKAEKDSGHPPEKPDDRKPEATESEEKKTVFDKIRSIPDKIKNIKYTIMSFCARIREVLATVSSWWTRLHEEGSQATIALVKRELGRIWRHVRPKKLKGTVCFGTDDPALTGQILGVCAILYPIYRDSLQITPDFEQARLEGSLYLKGRLRMFPLLLSGFRIYRDKNIKKLIKTIRT